MRPFMSVHGSSRRHNVARHSALALAALALMASGIMALATPSGAASVGTVTIGRFTFPSGTAKGSPINIGDVASVSQTPEVPPTLEATASYINAHLDGIDGHPIHLVNCDEMVSPTVAAECTQTFISDHVLAVTGFPLVWDSVGLTTATAHQIPYVAGSASALADYTNPYSWVVEGGFVSDEGSIVPYAVSKHIKSVAFDIVAVPGSENSAAYVSKLLKSKGIATTISVTHAYDAPDVTTPLTQALATKPQLLDLIDGATDCNREVVAARAAGFTGPIAVTPNCSGPATIKSMGSAVKNVLFTAGTLSLYDTSNPEVKLYNTIMKKYGGPAITETSLQDMSAFMTFDYVTTKLGGSATGTKIANYYKNAKNLPVFAGATFSKSNSPTTPPSSSYPNYYNSCDRYFTWNGKTFTDLGRWYCTYGATPSSSSPS